MVNANQSTRKGAKVTALHLEVNTAIFEKLDYYSKELGMTKRQIVTEALSTWFSNRQKEDGI